MQALAGRFLFHRRVQIEPPGLRKKPASKKKIHAPHSPEQDEEQNEGRRALREAFKENARAEESAFQTGQFIGFLYSALTKDAGRRPISAKAGRKWRQSRMECSLHSEMRPCWRMPEEFRANM
jgi:hypothetical protein